MKVKKYISVYLNDESPLLQAVGKLRDSRETIIDVLTPFPIHGLDKSLSFKRSRVPIAGFAFGLLGAVLAFSFQTWVFTVSYPLVFGGKPFFAVPSFIPITFEVTVLFAGIAMVAAMFIKSDLKPDIDFEAISDRITDDLFVIIIDAENEKTTIEKIRSTLEGIETVEIK